MKTKTTAALFAFFLGMLAIDLYYLKRKTMNLSPTFVLLLGLILGPIMAVLGVVRAVGYMWMSESDFDGQYNKGNKSYSPAPSTSRPRPTVSLTSELSELTALKERGSLTQEEFNAAKASLLQKKAA